ncbi:MAG TPA: glycosyltransferase family 39 protein [Pyrinomonadaceae bacterium]|nr:glycosyltransferase family 39 protein [Pyrinomonadaceae bacterium]
MKGEEGGQPAAPSSSPFTLSPLSLALIFLVALGVRVLAWQDTRFEAERTQAGVTADYKHAARAFVEGGPSAFLSRTSALADPNTLGHPPGYPVLLALVSRTFGESDDATRLVQIFADSLAAVVVSLVAGGLVGRGVALTAGLLVALSPQFVWNAVQLLPDALAALPVLLAALCVVAALNRSHLWKLFAAGALVGLSVWLRANAMLLAPFIACAVFLLFERKLRVRSALAVVAGAVFVIAPLTLRNAYVFGHFVPVSLGAGQTLLEGIGDFDPEGRLGIPSTDTGIQRMEAEKHQRPDYAATLFGPDAVRRERERLRLGWSVIKDHPLWFGGVMARRAASMLRLERARRVFAHPPVSHPLEAAEGNPPAWSSEPEELRCGGQLLSPRAELKPAPDAHAIQLTGDESKYGEQFASAPFDVAEDTDYLLRVPYKVTRGRMTVSVADAARGDTLASSIIEPLETKSEAEQPFRVAQLAFVSSGDVRRVRMFFVNAASSPLRPSVQISTPELYALGNASNLWTRAPRFVVSNVQKIFVTALLLPLSVAGFVLLWRGGDRRALLVLLAVPVYYLCAQSALHTEYRYVLVVHHFLFVLAAVSLCRAFDILKHGARSLLARRAGGVAPAA